jgi:2-(1,2-epoxy-1,2-dihydrophenyl)acetyl-CoA isomerase
MRESLLSYTKLNVVCDGAVVVVTLSDPGTRNALGPALCVELTGALEQIAQGRPAARAVVITGGEQAFCSGANLTDPDFKLGEGGDLKRLVDIYFNPLMRVIRDLPMPVVTAVSGAAAGFGASLAFMGDIVVAAETARFAPAFARIGLVPDGGATWLFPRLVGKARAMEMALLGDVIDGPKALDWGLVNRCVPDSLVMTTAMELARRLAGGPVALGMTRRLILDAFDRDWETQIQQEAEAQGIAGRTRDFKEGVAAFLEKRPAKFRGD